MRKLIYIFIALLVLCACKVQQPTASAQFTADVQKDIPFKVNGLKNVKDNTYSFRCDNYVALLPDYEVNADGACMVYRTTFMSTHDKQPANVIWRNIVINHKAKRVLCIDRFVKDGRTYGYVYFMQAETKQYSDEQTCHWDVSDHRLMLNVAGAIEDMTSLSITQLQLMTK
ncbi:MAG: hypothetical protein IK073_00435 [Paludibacteraceae bacterium]|nr:hypothetical protein [Paludibacteraceae bacterium]MBR6017072.1 hypothetical protein [Paludibacteraceae bacterium]MBR6508223.1 hypothetical protein [Paludibacteraceae bacterium]